MALTKLTPKSITGATPSLTTTSAIILTDTEKYQLVVDVNSLNNTFLPATGKLYSNSLQLLNLE